METGLSLAVHQVRFFEKWKKCQAISHMTNYYLTRDQEYRVDYLVSGV
jgi:hypothetical protein